MFETPRIPSALLSFFSNQPDYDMNEEFGERASRSPRGAHLWFWRETLRNVVALTLRELARTPGRTLLLALAGVVAVNFATGAFEMTTNFTFPPPTNQAIVALLIQLIVPLLCGRLAARILPGREFALALAYTGILACIALAAYFWAASHDDLAMWVAYRLYSYRFLVLTFVTTRVVSFWFGALRSRRVPERAVTRK